MEEDLLRPREDTTSQGGDKVFMELAIFVDRDLHK